MKRARVAPMVMSHVEDSQLIKNESDDDDELKKDPLGMSLSIWQNIVGKSNKKNEVQDKWRRMVNTVRYKVNFTKAFEDVNTALVNAKLKGQLNTTIPCILEQDNETDTLRNRTQQRLMRKSSVKNQEKGKWLLKYFIALSEITDLDQKKVDFERLELMIQSGVDVNCVDKHGQCVLHEVARIWHVDVAVFFLKHGSVINHPDNYGRTPLHVACATDYPEMVEFLLENGADINSRTYEENQTPIHYAAKNDAVESLKMLIRYGADMTDTDYKQRTPLQLAAELDRSATAELLIEEGAHAGVYDDSNMAALVVMIRKMPKVALQALDQFYSTNRANRRQFFYLNFLVPPNEAETCWAKSPMEVAVEYKQYQLLLHPVFQRLIEVKWQRLGKWYAWLYGILNFMVTILWTTRICILPVKQEEIYEKPKGNILTWMIVLDIFAALMLFIIILSETKEYFQSKKRNAKYKQWREEQLQRDLQYAHPRWPEERAYLEREIRTIGEYQASYLKDQWNFLDWITQFLMTATITLHIVNYRVRTKETRDAMRITASVTMIFLWLRLLKYARPFKTLGLFVVMLSHVIVDTLKILFLTMHIFIPYIAAFWIMFGAYGVKGYTMKNGEIFYSIFQMGVVGDYGFDDLSAHSELMSKILVGTFIFLGGIVCLNLFIALLSDTFQRVYDNAKATAEMQRARTINEIEEGLKAERLRKYNHWITRNCAPESMYYDDDVNDEEKSELKKMTHQIRARVEELHDLIRDSSPNINQNNNSIRNHSSKNNTKKLNELNSSCRSLRSLDAQQQQNNMTENVETDDLKMVVDTLNELKTEYYKSMIQTRAEIAGLGLMLKDLIDITTKKRQKRKQKTSKELPQLGRKPPTALQPTTNIGENDIHKKVDLVTKTNQLNEQMSEESREGEDFFEGYTFNEKQNNDDKLISKTWGSIFTKIVDTQAKSQRDRSDTENQRQKEKHSDQESDKEINEDKDTDIEEEDSSQNDNYSDFLRNKFNEQAQLHHKERSFAYFQQADLPLVKENKESEEHELEERVKVSYGQQNQQELLLQQRFQEQQQRWKVQRQQQWQQQLQQQQLQQQQQQQQIQQQQYAAQQQQQQ